MQFVVEIFRTGALFNKCRAADAVHGIKKEFTNMKRIISFSLCLLFLLSAAVLSGCEKEKEYVPEGPTDVDYGEVAYLDFDDGTALKFKYLDCFKKSEDETAFVSKTPDSKGVLSYDFFESYKDYEAINETYRIPTRKYAEIASYTEDEARDYMEICLGLSVQDAKVTVDSFNFEKFDNYVVLSLEETAEYNTTGEIQKNWIVKYVVENERVYTIQAFAPASLQEKYGAAFKDVVFDIENALKKPDMN